ncbi:acetoin dehydrogenase operon transcriptional activator AcoR [Clostridium homopropionicum DSM 5847]|uniref:Acetoin dehydrogenase operon transcriptional activator AcoR n=1 Tax=Clostridium homopropionicum DSM 5847 TaxID=1121318 RepID=A0A0L6Z5R5_9CLOT|nr:sigma-54-dependent Fis family transcriptional regulator [Clostridium homopropionicum]KOA18302.1 acetoin dehydrogenase operon transcriptional activator AcoR [Clostridium homopropionicum DSM 5847]SFF69502.1 Transcriptional regulator containing PAS, AAA-type ATPase, and DNA-binding Fis domains [Clostridium homopropionicum]
MDYKKDQRSEVIEKSHLRSINYGIEKERLVSKKILKGRERDYNIKSKESIIKVATPVMDTLQEILQDSGFFIVLTDEEGCILNTVGDKDILLEAEKMDMVVGAYMDEKSIGTNAMAIAIKEDMPIQVSAKEHFINAYHKWTCSAAPIHNINDEIIGSINLTGKKDKVHPHTLGLAVASVKSIENQLKADFINEKLEEAYEYMNAIVDSMSYGICAVNFHGEIKSINKNACIMLNVDKEGILSKSIDLVLPTWKQIIKELQEGKTFIDRECSFNNRDKNDRFLVNATPIKNGNEVLGMLIVFREMHNVYKIVNKYGGMIATYTFDDIIGKSPELLKVLDFAKTIASTPSTVLIQGESGTGKELLAQAIHNYGIRKRQSFVAINCGAIPKSLIESELFGYEEGAFTGAKSGGNIGKFQLANGGTLFLDEIGEMPLDMQVKLLRVLQEGYIVKVGGNKVIPIDVRIIAATNKDLKEEVKKGTFREDLFYRLTVIPIRLPSLRERKGDLEVLIRHYLRIKASKLNKPIPRIDKKLIEEIREYNWPGNIRELENFIENIVSLEGKTTFDLKENVNINPSSSSSINKFEEGMTIKDMEIKLIKETIERCNGNMTKVAKNLGIGRNTLYCKIKNYNILT